MHDVYIRYIFQGVFMGDSLEWLLAQERVVRKLVCGGAGLIDDQELAQLVGPGEGRWVWRVGYCELFLPRISTGFPLEEVAGLIPTSILWRSEWQVLRGTLELTMVFRDRTVERVNLYAAQETQGLFARLEGRGFGVSGGLGSAVASLECLPLSFQEARLASGYGVVHGFGIYVFHPENELGGLASADLESFPERFYSTLLLSTPVQPLMDEFFGVLARTGASIRRLHLDIQNLFSRLAMLVPSDPSVEFFYHVLDLVHDPAGLRVALEDLCEAASRSVLERRSSLADRKVKEFQDYVGDNFMDCHLNITDVGRALQISPSYLGKILKRGLRVTFVEFVTQYRMARARELLSGSDLMTYQIAEAVGYPYTHYFSATFKKHMGATPSEYRASVRSGDGLVTVAGVS